ncbi:MAG: hypothetical protein AVDCRST_MAG41-471 [uncultured Corynebacteriales bacterium]|uniref:Transferase n=1 Tax=uncultured Mycobacteriales bacterium TaxID=581187 RepID=A0A6J4HC41_9ACTN|nr:MAG: hypothetical protein AVDCRST_MAG41-471 [uncultured Corynebacteriales bacterium]
MTELLVPPAATAPGQTRVVRAGVAPGTVVRCGATDTLLSGMAVSLVFLYERAVPVDRLAAGLAAALARVPVFGGSLRTTPGGLPEIVCDDAGVPLTVADSPDPLAVAAGRMTLPTAGFVDTVPAGRDRPADAPLTSVKVTRLGDGGMVVGCSWHHAIGDLQSFMLLMRAWSAAVEGTPPPEVVLVADREAQLDSVLPAHAVGRSGYRLPDAEEREHLGRELRAAPRANRIVQVYFAPAEVDRMRAAYSVEADRRLSTNDAVLGHLLATIRRLDGDTAARRLAMPVNYRRHVGLPPAAVGNLVSEVDFVCAPAARPAEIAAAVRAAVDDFVGTHLSVRANREFLARIGPDRVFDTMPVGFDPENRTFFLTNWSRAGAYDVTFDGGRPACFCPEIPLPTAWSSWLVEGFGGVGHLATVVVPARLAGRLRTDSGLHVFRDPADELPPLAAEIRKLA